MFRIIEKKEAEFECAHDILRFIHSFMSAKRFQKMIESILMMVIEDATNIMKVVKGIVISIDDDSRIEGDKKPYKINEDLSLFSLNYSIKEQIFSIVLGMGNTTSSIAELDMEETGIVSRR